MFKEIFVIFRIANHKNAFSSILIGTFQLLRHSDVIV